MQLANLLMWTVGFMIGTSTKIGESINLTISNIFVVLGILDVKTNYFLIYYYYNFTNKPKFLSKLGKVAKT